MLDKIYKVIDRGIIKAHSQCGGVDISNLQGKDIDVLVEDGVLIMTLGITTVSFVLTSHYRSGTKYMHWIRLNKALIKLSKTITEVNRDWWFNYTERPLTLFWDILELDRDSATSSDVRRAYRRLAHIVHPDHGGSNELMDQLTWAKNTALVILNINEGI